MKRKIKLFDPYFDDSEKNAILKTLNSHFWASGNGVGNVKEFETLFKKKCIFVKILSSTL